MHLWFGDSRPQGSPSFGDAEERGEIKLMPNSGALSNSGDLATLNECMVA